MVESAYPIYNTPPGFSARKFEVITPHDTNDLAFETRGVLVGVAGDLEVIGADDTTAVVLPVQAGWNPIAVTRILAANTTATGIVAAY